MTRARGTAGSPGWVGRIVSAAPLLIGGLVGGLLGVLLGGLVLAGPAGAVDGSLGTPGFCPDDDGVTVVVDFQELGGKTLVRCAPGTEPRSGLEVLRDAGIQIEGVQRWGDSFVCRIENRPAPTEALAAAGDDDYHEACVDTPPPDAFWGYWQADVAGSWQYSSLGVRNTTVEAGGFEGWSFSSGTAGANPPPGLSPERPAGADSATPEPGARPPGGPGGPGGSGEGGPDEGGAGQEPAGAPEPAWTGGQAAPDVRDQQPAGSPWPAVLGLSAVTAVGGLAAAASVRRRRRAALERSP